MTLPMVILGLAIALLYGAFYHAVRGGSGWRLLLFFGLSILGFILGQLLGIWRGWYLFMIGSLNLGMGSVGSILVLVGGEWLIRVEAKNKSSV